MNRGTVIKRFNMVIIFVSFLITMVNAMILPHLTIRICRLVWWIISTIFVGI